MLEKVTCPDAFLLTTVGSDQNGIGSIFIRDILSRIPDFKTVWVVEKPFLLKVGRASWGRLGSALDSVLVRIDSWQNLRFYLFLKFKLIQRVNDIEQAFRVSGARLIWVTASSPELICISAHLAERGHDVRVTVWDAPEYLLQNVGFSKRNCERVLNHFDRLISNMHVGSVISDDMLIDYSKRFPLVALTIMRHGIAPMKRFITPAAGGAIRFVFAGSLYSKNEWNAFVAALELANWRLLGREVKLGFIGRFPLKGAARPACLDDYGSMAQDAAMDIMKEMDVGYLPYWLNPEKEFVARTSFPGKMTAYSAAGLCVFHHGPRTSSVTKFLESYPYGVACDSLDPELVLARLEDLVQKVNSIEYVRARDRAMNEALSDKAMITAFRQLVELPAGE